MIQTNIRWEHQPRSNSWYATAGKHDVAAIAHVQSEGRMMYRLWFKLDGSRTFHTDLDQAMTCCEGSLRYWLQDLFDNGESK